MNNPLLGDVKFSRKNFQHIDSVFHTFTNKAFHKQTGLERIEAVNRALLELIQQEPEPCFLLAAVLDFIDRVAREKILDGYLFKHFEFWLNQHSNLSFEDNYRVRAKIAGQLVDRSDYQLFFPIGGGKIFEGTHFVTAHRSPDLDTTVASFWGWLDAFAARVTGGLHCWNVPGGPPQQIEIDWLFKEMFGESLFTRLSKNLSVLHVTGQDLMVYKGMLCKELSDSIIGIDHEKDPSGVVVVDERGLYVGEWHSGDVEAIRDVILLVSSSLRWFENALQLQLMSFFGRKQVRFEEAKERVHHLFHSSISQSEPGAEFTPKQKEAVLQFIVRVLGIPSGLDCTFEKLGKHLGQLAGCVFEDAETLVARMKTAGLFQESGVLVEERSSIFAYLEKTLNALHEAIFHIRKRLEKLDIALKTKKEVFGRENVSIHAGTGIEEMRAKMGSHSFITVLASDGSHSYPIGVVHATAIHKQVLGTVSLRDFCNREEMGIPSYLEVISVIDHHRTTLSTGAPPFAIISDAQSSNTLVARQAFLLNDRHSLLGQTEAGIEAQLKEHLSHATPSKTRLTQNLLQRRMIAKQKTKFFIHPDREFIEYLHLIYAIIDDTDLLTKVTVADVECVAELLNRMKSLIAGRVCEIVSLDDLPRNRGFAKRAAQRILQQEDMYSLYRKVYDLRKAEVEQSLELAAVGHASNVFADTKEQNGCCRIGQTKMFASNVAAFAKFAGKIRSYWQKNGERIAAEKPEIALHLHMISTVADAEQMFQGKEPQHKHKDELWIWISPLPGADELLQQFLSAFSLSSGLKGHLLEVEIVGEKAEEIGRIFQENAETFARKIAHKEGPTVAIVRFTPGLLNSRKSMVTPFLPKMALKN
jgi:hypothetical protein